AVALLPREARVHEPLVALDGGADGLDVLRRVAASAGDWLAPDGHLLLEIGADQAGAATGALSAAGLTPDLTTDAELHAPGGCNSARRLRRSLIGNAPTMPTEASEPSSAYRPSSNDPIASGPLLCSRYPATTQSAVRSCLILNMTRLSGWYVPSSGLATTPS